MTGLVLPDAGTDPAGFVLAVADLREARIKAATPGQWEAFCPGSEGFEVREVVAPNDRRRRRRIARLASEPWDLDRADADHIAAEANPAHALGEVALWRGIADRHGGVRIEGKPYCQCCRGPGFPCADLLAVVAAARAYLGEQT